MRVFKLMLAFCLCHRYLAFVTKSNVWRRKSSPVDRNICLDALTERQQQFWEDVEEGLDDIEKYYRERGSNIDRIRRFGMR